MEYSKVIKRKITQYFKEKLKLYDYRNGWLKGDCPYCGKHKFGVDVNKGRANCFACGNKLSPLKVIMELEDLETKPQLYHLLNTFEGVDFLEPKIEIREWKKVELPESFRLLSLGNSMLSELARNYMRGRGFNITSLTMKGIGYCTKGEYAGFIIFPFYQNNELIYFIGRQFIQMGERFKNPSVEDFGLGKSMLTYNVDSLLIYRKIYLVESIPNSITIGDNSIATLGKKVSNYQLSMILRSPVEDVVLGFDPDAIADTIRLALKLQPHKRVKILMLPEKKDINDIGKKATKAIEKESKWLSYNDILKLKNEYGQEPLNTPY